MPTKRREATEIIEQPSSEEIDSKYRLIILAAKRSKQLQRGARPRIATDPTKHKFTRIALEEVIQGRVRFYRTEEGERSSDLPTSFYSGQAPRLGADSSPDHTCN
jgi:DNA-directed RNA polymerase omega subunit